MNDDPFPTGDQTEAASAGSPSPASEHPDQIGPYRIFEKLGEGGFGQVFAAEQTEPVKRRVALKVIKAGMDTKEVLARFEAERQALALMNHSGIAQVFDAGETELGRPYFVMELIQGEPITAYCDRQRLSTKQRLELFISVCAAIQHAHQKGVIHRDIKPGNILITTEDDKPTPKVIDFGIAKATETSLTGQTLHTVQGQIMGTPAYMSPEQADMTGLNVDTRTDVYALGVLLYELLTSTLPFESKTLMEGGIEGMHRVIREKEAPRPSTRISSLKHDSAIEAAVYRQTEPLSLAKLVRNELDWVTMKALEKDPARRYETVSELAADIARHLADEPVQAHPPSRTYQLQKLIHRNKLPTAFAATVTALLVGLVVTMIVLRERAETARAEAQERAEELELVTEFQSSMLSEIDAEAMGTALVEDFSERVREVLAAEGASPEGVESEVAAFEGPLRRVNATNAALTLIDEQVLKRAVEAIEEEFADQPVTQAALQQTVADTYAALGLNPQALPLQERALETRRRVLGDDHTNTLASINAMGLLLNRMGKLDEVLPYYAEALEGMRRVHGDDDQATLILINNIGSLLNRMGKLEEARPYYEESLEGMRRLLGDDHQTTLILISNMGSLLERMGKFEEALPYFKEALAGMRRVLGDDHPSTLITTNGMGFLLESMGKLEEAFTYYEEALEGSRRVLGDDHPETLTSINNMGFLLKSMGRLDEALLYHEEALERRRRVSGDDHPNTLISTSNMGSMLKSMGKLDEALPYYEEALEGGRRVLGDDHPSTLITIYNMGDLLLKQGKPENTIALLAPVEAKARQAFTGGNLSRLGIFLTSLGRSRAATGAFAEAETNLTEAWSAVNGAENATIEQREKALTGLAELYDAWHVAEPGAGHDANAAEWRAKLAEFQAENPDK